MLLFCFVVFIPSLSCILMTETLQNFLTFVTLVWGGGGGKKTKGIRFFIRHQHFDVTPKRLGRFTVKLEIFLCD